MDVLEQNVVLYRWWPAEVCRLSVLSKCGIKDTWLTADAEFAVRLFGSRLLYGSDHQRYFSCTPMRAPVLVDMYQ